MQWIVEGADAENGQDVCITVDAENRIQAETTARQRGVLVASVRRASSPADALEAMFGPPAAAVAEADGHKAASSPVPASKRRSPVRRNISTSSIAEGLGVQVEYAQPSAGTSDEDNVPAYRGLRLAGILLATLCVPAYALETCALGLSAIAFQHSLMISYTPTDIVIGVLSMLSSAAPLVIAVTLHAMSSGCFALRDIARSCRRIELK